MILLVLGLMILVAGSVVRAAEPRFAPVARLFTMGGPVLMGLGVLLSSLVQIDAGEVGVKKLFGSVSPDVLSPGLHLINPLAIVERFDARTQNYTMSAVQDEGRLAGDDAIRALTADGLEVVIDVSVLYRVIAPETPQLLSSVGTRYEDVIVRPIARSRIRDATVHYQAVQLYTEKRDEYQSRIASSIEADLAARHITLESLLIRNIALPDSVKGTIEGKIQAEQEAQKMVFVLDKERQEAERKRVEAQGIADSQRIVSESLNDRLLRYEQIKAMRDLSLSPNSKIVISGGEMPVILDGTGK